MTKEEKIKEAYKKLGLNLEKSKFNMTVLFDGLCSLTDIIQMLGNSGNLSKYIRENFDKTDLGYLPKSLQGIETNNGWIKIESESDLPKEDYIDVFVKQKGNEEPFILQYA